MSFGIPSDFSSSFDPAIHLHSESTDPIPNTSFSEEIAALDQQTAEDFEQKTKDGVVIQHRAWHSVEAFLSEDDHLVVTPTKAERTALVTSSPPTTRRIIMSVLETQGVVDQDASRKRRKLDQDYSPLRPITNNVRSIAGFALDEDSEDEDEEPVEYTHKSPPKPGEPLDIETQEKNAGQTCTDFEDIDALEQEATILQPTKTSGRHELLTAELFSGRKHYIGVRRKGVTETYERIIAARSTTTAGRATRSFYGIEIHDLMDEIEKEKKDAEALEQIRQAVAVVPTVETSSVKKSSKAPRLWTEKYRARKFTDLVGDERTHRSVLHWLKSWDPIVFPGAAKKSTKPKHNHSNNQWDEDAKQHRKVLMLTGPPGLGKTTLAHVCAKQAGYEVQEINASDERSSQVVKGRIRDMVGTENVRGVSLTAANGEKSRKAGKPVCVIVDEVDGVVGGSGAGGDGGFVKALIDLINLDQKNSNSTSSSDGSGAPKKKKKGDRFRLLRPLILICNDVYHPSLRPLRQSSFAEIIHVRKPPLQMVVSRVHSIFEREGIACDLDGTRRLCEATWGVGSKKESFRSGTVEGDIRSVLVVGEWVAARWRSSCLVDPTARVSKKWIEENILSEVSYGGGAARSLGRGGSKEVVDRVFQEGAGFPKTADNSLAKSDNFQKDGVIGVTEAAKRRAMGRLREMIDASGEHEKIITDCFSIYPDKPMQDDNFLSKPNAAYEWLYFHDFLSSQLFHSQEWELAPYLSSSILAFHNLFASSMPRHAHDNKFTKDEPDPSTPFSGPAAPYLVSESLKANTAAITALQSNLSLPLARLYRARDVIASELLPYTLRLLAPDVKPVVIHTSTSAGARSAPTASVRRADEKERVNRAVECMSATGVRFERSKVEDDGRNKGGWVYRMEPGLDALGTFASLKSKGEGVRYAVRQVLEGEWRRRAIKRASSTIGAGLVEGKVLKTKAEEVAEQDARDRKAVKRDFFGRAFKEPTGEEAERQAKVVVLSDVNRVWVSFHEGYSNAVRRPITVEEFMRGL
ncbi:hypothetical protein BT63DRAFT_428958 [Microthyrium microscopicum]|uniref:AAA+ ATPase domain-containing protein n=1 Tax=Microthyrium microscopicum TaxID=703497 RepID=A0A6A6U165_9PEZI|nr:hypothetical protein BT63DRAFT_428958 [Microthyrium microscopicum]